VLLQRPDSFHSRILVARLRLWGRLTFGGLRAFGLLGLFFSPQAVTKLS
jgi:hypothetical protein